MPTPTIILASASPRRLELLGAIGLVPEVVPADIDETPRPGEPAERYVERLARDKAAAIAMRAPGRVVLGADTIVISPSREIFGKPRDADDARRMLRALFDTGHEVTTAFSVTDGARTETRSVVTRVIFRAVTNAELDGYLASREWDGKAGAYAIQGRAAAFCARIEGSYSNVVGLPLREVADTLLAFGVLEPDWPKR